MRTSRSPRLAAAFMRSRFSTFRQSYHWMLVGVPSEPASSFRRAACNNAWNFITTRFTFPRTRHASHGSCLSANAMFRLVPSGDSSARAFLRILTLSIRRPAYGQRRPLRGGFRRCTAAAAVSRLYRAFDGQAAARRTANRRISEDVSGRCPVIPSIGLSVLPWQGLRRHDAQSFQL